MADAAELGRQWFERIQAGDVDAALALLSDDVDFSSPAGGFRGAGGARPFLQGYVEAFPDGRFELRTVVGAGRMAAIEGTYAGTHTGILRTPNGDIPATGRQIALPYATVLEAEGDRLIAHRAYWDMLGFMAQLGLGPQPDA